VVKTEKFNCRRKNNGVMTTIFWSHVTSSVTWPFNSRWVTSYGWSIVTMGLSCRAPRSKKWNFRTQCLQNFRTISGYFCWFHKAQDTENARFSVLINVIHRSRSVLQC